MSEPVIARILSKTFVFESWYDYTEMQRVIDYLQTTGQVKFKEMPQELITKINSRTIIVQDGETMLAEAGSTLLRFDSVNLVDSKPERKEVED